jgi:histidine ammonia-lyase
MVKKFTRGDAARKARQVVRNVKYILAAELMAVAQAEESAKG